MSVEYAHCCSVVDWLNLRIRPRPFSQREFFTLSRLVFEVARDSRIENQNAKSSFPVEFKVARPDAFSCKAVLSLVKFAPK